MPSTVYRRRYDFRALRGWIMPEVLLTIAPTDSISVAETIVIRTNIILISATDTVTVTELTPVFVSGLAIRIDESVTVAEGGFDIGVFERSLPRVLLPFLVPAATDSVSIAEPVTLLMPVLTIGISESITVAEGILVAGGVLDISVEDNVSIAEATRFAGLGSRGRRLLTLRVGA